MKMQEIIDKVSELYRNELSYRKELQRGYTIVVNELLTADHNGGKNITYDRYQMLKAKKLALQQSMNDADKYCDGIATVRELLMDLGFDTEVE